MSGGTIGVAGPEDASDISTIIDWVLANHVGLADPNKVGMVGLSYGGMLALLGAAADPRSECLMRYCPLRPHSKFTPRFRSWGCLSASSVSVVSSTVFVSHTVHAVAARTTPWTIFGVHLSAALQCQALCP